MNPDNLRLPVTIYTKSQQLPFNFCWNISVLHNLPLISIILPATMLNSPINSFCPLDTALVITSDDFHSISPSTLPLPVLHLLWWHFFKTLTWHSLDYVFTYIYSLLTEKDTCDRWNISFKLPCVCVCLLSGDLFIFSVRVSSFFSNLSIVIIILL